MFTFNGEPILDMSRLVTPEKLIELDREIVVGLAKTRNAFLSVGHELTRGDAELSLYDHSFKDVGIAEKELEPWELETMKSMTYGQQQKFLRYAKGAYHPWSVCLPLTPNSMWLSKMETENKSPTPEAVELFPCTLEFVASLPIFKAIGRICIFGVDPGQHVTCHRDFDPDEWQMNDELLMLSPRGAKRFYVFDPRTKMKHYTSPEVKAYIFHDLNYHGADSLPYFTYTLRIDGIYTDEFRASIGCNRDGMEPGEFSKRLQERLLASDVKTAES